LDDLLVFYWDSDVVRFVFAVAMDFGLKAWNEIADEQGTER
jgi:hypothetical protein